MEISGYYPGLIGQLTALHARYYAEHWSLDHTFEAQVGQELSRFILDFDPKVDGIWAARAGESLVGAAAMDGHSNPTEGIRLRWFIVDPAGQGTGLGRNLLAKALDFCRECGPEQVYLWTFAGLNQARRLYEGFGFELAEEAPQHVWGRELVEQKFTLSLK